MGNGERTGRGRALNVWREQREGFREWLSGEGGRVDPQLCVFQARAVALSFPQALIFLDFSSSPSSLCWLEF